jgi:rod shape-determining protein MreC
VACCLAVAFAPLDLRRRARAELLDLHAWLLTVVPGVSAEAAVASDSNRVRLLETEVTRLRRALLEAGSASELVQQAPDVRLIPAEVLPLAGGADVLRRVALARGERDGVRPGQPVLADGVLVGRVANVTPATCEVLLVTDPEFRIRAALARPEGEVEGLLVGDGSALLRFEPALLNDAELAPRPEVGETVASSRASILCGVPAVIGAVESVERPPGAGQALGRVRPGFDPTRLDRVVVVQAGKAS